jgi:localization factor PodJL
VVEAPAQQAQTPAAAPLQSQYVETVRAVEARSSGALTKLKAIADSGYTPAQFYLGKLYESGDAGVVRNLGEARRWTAKAAEGGDRSAMHNLALYYFEGQGGPQDLTNAAQWFRKAAELGVVDSQYNLGLLYQAGSGVERDLTAAYKWFSIASNGGDAQARASAVDLEARLSPAALAAADRDVQAFRPGGGARNAQAALPPRVSVTAAQRILGRLGYYKGPANGAGSAAFTVAVSAYQRDQGLAATGALDPNTAARLSVFTR